MSAGVIGGCELPNVVLGTEPSVQPPNNFFFFLNIKKRDNQSLVCDPLQPSLLSSCDYRHVLLCHSGHITAFRGEKTYFGSRIQRIQPVFSWGRAIGRDLACGCLALCS